MGTPGSHRRRRPARAVLTLAGLVVAACTLVLTCLGVLAGGSDPEPRLVPRVGEVAARAGSLARRTEVVPRDVLRVWDAARATAWESADSEGLARLYMPDSVAGRRDVRLLRQWSARSLRVTRLEPQVLALDVEQASATHLVLLVTDRLAVVRAERDGEPVRLPRDEPSTRRVVLVHDDGAGWRVAAVTEV